MRTSLLAPSSPRRNGCIVEMLESRIAPASIAVGNPSVNDTEYKEGPGFGQTGTELDPIFLTPFVDTADALNASDPIVKVIGSNAGLYYTKLTTGDRMFMFGPGGYSNFITGPNGTPLKGTVIAIFQDDGDYEVEPNELVGLALGKNVSVEVSGTVFGDVIANYNDLTGTLGSSAEASAGTAKDLLTNQINYFGATAVTGSIVAGGDIKALNLTNSVAQILTGTAADGYTFDINGGTADTQTLTVLPPAIGKHGPNISNVTVGDLGRMQAGDGGAQGVGGNITNVTIVADSNGWMIQAGDGGSGIAGAFKGGAGGKVTKVLANGLDESQTDSTPNSLGGMQVLGGKGGDALPGTTGNGGKGGDVSGVSIGFEKSRGLTVRSVNPMADAVWIKGGDGGLGKSGGAGGNVTNDRAFAAPTGVGNDIVFQGGLGGLATTVGGKAGAGGSVSKITGLAPDAATGRVVLIAGDGGGTNGGVAIGANGGSISNITLIASSINLSAGDGSTGSAGGKGGLISGIKALDGFLDVSATNFIADAGAGGSGTVKKGGNGGSVSKITIQNAKLVQLDINQAALSANGGNSMSGNGGVGGSISTVVVTDELLGSGAVRMRAGDGGQGGALPPVGGSGGAGGSIFGNNVITGFGLSVVATAGAGGDASFKGAGGAGGSITNFAFVELPDLTSIGGDATLTAGKGGAGADTGAGGKGGRVATLELISDGAIAVTAGAGGSGGLNGAAGAGGEVRTGAFQAVTSAQITAGNAGLTGVKKGAGGAVTTVNILANTFISVTGGDGSAGGAGGSITGIGVTNFGQTDGPTQSLTIVAGAGSGLGTVAGNGGSVTKVDGFIAHDGLTIVRAGDGGAGTTKAAIGGSVLDVNFLGGGSNTAEVRISAGNSGTATTAAKGGTGGSVKGIGMGLKAAADNDPFAIDPDTIIRYIAAGNGGSTGSPVGKGGAGGSVTDVRVNHDIGVRSGQGFGFSTMGGIFAGSGGDAATLGLAGSVTKVTADGIASIVAGRPENGDTITERNLANVVGDIVLTGSVDSVVKPDGHYINFTSGVPMTGPAKANILGGVVNPGAPGANTFDTGEYDNLVADGGFGIGDKTNANTDGFVAAYHFLDAPGVDSVRPEALLTFDPVTGTFVFYDLNNTNGQKVIA